MSRCISHSRKIHKHDHHKGISEDRTLKNEKELDCVLQEIMVRWGIPGLGVGIVEDGKIVYAQGFGVQSLETGMPVTPDQLFYQQKHQLAQAEAALRRALAIQSDRANVLEMLSRMMVEE